jgi:predicted Fe-S protein YdhL (DUF1289 family)
VSNRNLGTETISLLEEVAEFLEGQADVRDGSYGEQVPNRAMSLMAEVELTIERLKRDSLRGPVDKGPVPVECPDTKAPCMEFCDADKGDQCARTNEQISTMTDAEKATYWFDLYLEETTKRRELERRLSLGATPQHTKEDV